MTTVKTTDAPPAVQDSRNKCDPYQVKAGSVWSRHSFGITREGIQLGVPEDIVNVENTEGRKWSIGASLVKEEFSFADQWDVEVATNRTSIVNVMTARPFMAMTVTFRKKVEPKDVADKLWDTNPDLNEKDFRKAVEEAMAGEVRTMAGYHHGEHDAHGRLKFTEILKCDPEIRGYKEGPGIKTQQRLIDPRTVEALVVARTRYVEK